MRSGTVLADAVRHVGRIDVGDRRDQFAEQPDPVEPVEGASVESGSDAGVPLCARRPGSSK